MLAKIQGLIERIKDFFLGLFDKRSAVGVDCLEPSELVGAALEAMCKHRMTWPDVTELPSYVTVEVSQADYKYYANRLDLCQRHIADTAARYAQQNNWVFETEPVVHLYPNPNLPLGVVRAFASFTDDSDEEEAVAFSFAKTAVMAGKTDESSTQASEARTAKGEQQVPATESMYNPAQSHGVAGIPPTAVMKRPWDLQSSGDSKSCSPVGHLTYKGRMLEVHPGDSVGHVRSPNQNSPDICLEGEEFRYVSLSHGHFEFKNRWYFVDDGSSNGTSVKRRGVSTRLTPSRPFALEDKDFLSFGDTVPMLFSVK